METDKFIAKIEGHGSLNVDWDKEEVKLRTHEGERLFEGMLVGRTLEESHWITPRICGVCPIAHNLASLAACEAGLEIKISETSKLLRELMVCGQMLQSHSLHLFFLALPDYLGIDRGTELAAKNPKAFQAALAIKEVSDDIAFVVAGRNVHPTTTAIGGFHKIPAKKQLEELLNKIKKTRTSAELALKICLGIKFPALKVSLEFLAIDEESKIILSGKGEKTEIKDYKRDIEEEIRENSTAKFGSYKKREIFVGSLARLYHFLPDGNLRSFLDFENPFHNNLAQAIEILLYRKEAEEILEKLLKIKLENDKPSFIKIKEGAGIGAIEAPRGGLYHELHFDEKNIITYANIITPTVQNLTSIEKSASELLKQNKNASREKTERLLEMLVRAYDPCITCSVH
ncbi:MAG: nickel-dependent hydrogenase large subunit [Candidatus Pacebacteria bacterium]|nr:nickel-dependent hydrogenase large subunit [Candidatus Paceibacterota bacterium]